MGRKLQILVIMVSLFITIFGVTALAQSPLDSNVVIGEVRMWGGGTINLLATATPPPGWLYAHGSCVSQSTYAALYAVYGSRFGSCSAGNFRLPDMRGNMPIGAVGEALCTDQLNCSNTGGVGGEESITLTIAQMPSHSHVERGVPGEGSRLNRMVRTTNGAGDVANSGNTTGNTGDGQPHNNMPPFVGLNFIIAYTNVVTATPTPTATHTPTPTNTPTATATPTGTVTIYLPSVISSYTYTLSSGEILDIPVQMGFGQIIISGTLMVIIAVFGLWLLVRLR